MPNKLFNAIYFCSQNSWLTMRLLLAVMLIIVLTACGRTLTIGISPAKQQLKETVCENFKLHGFSGKHDSAETIQQEREYNATLGVFDCPKE